MTRQLDAQSLLELAQAAEARIVPDCSCTKASLEGWQSQPLSLDETRLVQVGTLLNPELAEPTYSEYLPEGTNYWSAEAPVAPYFFPYNRCDVWQCSACNRLYLRYTEGGGYFVDRRIRALHARLITDVSE
ncbi:hypothetical protein [Paraburkholderia acidisoli]|uniref:Uncharacterized protein n=1 Tax=Paraburkholderia acidisoli TaxID=2571748 RepID=A0A7Z2GR85_9BURK|nr:hypothetical protein [Paraburkholderia acidisoli]QGZ66453.1 hypothetical protein FAZ98_32240 [Paraburkholderia acidisoli]